MLLPLSCLGYLSVVLGATPDIFVSTSGGVNISDFKSSFPHDTIPDYILKYAPVVHLYSEEKYLPYDINEYVKHFVVRDETGQMVAPVPPVTPFTIGDVVYSVKNALGGLFLSSSPQVPLNTAQTQGEAQGQGQEDEKSAENGDEDSNPPDISPSRPLSGLRELAEISHSVQTRKLDPNNLFLSAVEDYSVDPDWITGRGNLPSFEDDKIANAPAVLIVVDKGDGIVDAFWFCFYSFNLGPFVMGGGPYGNHIGDWEHSLVRFKDGEPVLLWMSAHGGGSAYDFGALEKLNTDSNRPVLFSARGTHANYATVGQHSHDIPYHMLSDFTDRGPLWDLSKNYLAYTYDGHEVRLANGSDPGREDEYGDWLNYLGHWGDKKLAPEDPRQRYHPFEWLMIDGPLGPLAKNLLRRDPCQRSKWWNFSKSCRIRHRLLMGEGIESEGGGCARALDAIGPYWLQWLLRVVTSGGFGCYLVDRIWG
ncbi:Vps62p [Sugiyamaella lignohabitans]|uniref:Vps62p n=1 Tax=Sugiyamaella lignohabitans TaxID=796027 RepID=A0A167DDT8_9ASCO|nr:Vps62p [Sugiyamaella lignohabitans]ANB12802.1 Vps62p [Sugiyamaella lignohabitans]